VTLSSTFPWTAFISFLVCVHAIFLLSFGSSTRAHLAASSYRFLSPSTSFIRTLNTPSSCARTSSLNTVSGYMDECTVAVNDDLSADIAMDCASTEYGDFHVDDAPFARLASARPRRQKPACEHVLKSLCFTASTSAVSSRSAHGSNIVKGGAQVVSTFWKSHKKSTASGQTSNKHLIRRSSCTDCALAPNVSVYSHLGPAHINICASSRLVGSYGNSFGLKRTTLYHQCLDKT